jgi:hypothetical protein
MSNACEKSARTLDFSASQMCLSKIEKHPSLHGSEVTTMFSGRALEVWIDLKEYVGNFCRWGDALSRYTLLQQEFFLLVQPADDLTLHLCDLVEIGRVDFQPDAKLR